MPYGLVVGIGLLVLVTALTFAIGARAADSVKRFRAEHHVHFRGRREP